MLEYTFDRLNLVPNHLFDLEVFIMDDFGNAHSLSDLEFCQACFYIYDSYES